MDKRHVDFQIFLNELKSSPAYAGQIVHVHEVPSRTAHFAGTLHPLSKQVKAMLAARGIKQLYSHQAEAIDLIRKNKNIVVVTSTASGKTLCYTAPIIEMLLDNPEASFLLLYPTKALCQDQFKGFSEALKAAGLADTVAGVYDGDTPAPMRRKLRDTGSVIFTNPDMLHAALMPQHARWSRFLSNLRLIVIDELHVYSGIFGSNMANLMRRFKRLCEHYDSTPQMAACSATTANPGELAERVIGPNVNVIHRDGSPAGKRTYVFWNPPRIRGGNWRSRRSANVEAHELMAMLVQRNVPTITFSKARTTAEMIHRYVRETLQQTAPNLAKKLSPYRGGYRPSERREIERRLFDGELLGVSTTRALELGIDVGGLDASILVGYPGTLASFFQQSGRAGRQDRDALVIVVGLDTSINQYVMSHPDYLFGRPIEEAVVDSDNPFVITGHLRCAAHELPLGDLEIGRFGPHADTALRVLAGNMKLAHINNHWYHAASETPQHEISLRDTVEANVLIEDVDTGEVIGEMDRFDAPPLLHPDAIYMHLGDTYLVLSLDLDRNIARVKRVDVDYYTQPHGGTDVHHVDNRLREKPFGTGTTYWGEVTAYFNTYMFEKIHFYSLDAISWHGLDLPTFMLETMAVWIVPSESLMEKVRKAGLDAHSGLRGIGYATRMLLPLFMTCDTLDFSHSIGSANSPWNAIFIYERYPHGLGFTERAYDHLHEILPMVLDNIRQCDCEDGCPCCVGKPLRQSTTWNVERGEASIPSKAATIMILEGLMANGSTLSNPDTHSLTDSDADSELRIEMALRRRLERMREPGVFHPIEPRMKTQYPEMEDEQTLEQPDVSRRAQRRRDFDRELRKRIAKCVNPGKLPANVGKAKPPPGMKTKHGNTPPTAFPGRPDANAAQATQRLGDSLAVRARRIKKGREESTRP